MRFMLGPWSTKIDATLSSSISAPSLCSALAIADSSTLLTHCRGFLVAELQNPQRFTDGLAADLIGHEPALLR